MGSEPDNEDKALDALKKAEQEVLRDEEKLVQDQRKVESAIEDLEKARDHGHDDVHIIVDGKEHRVPRRDWVVSDLKAQLKIDPAKVLAEITPHGLKDLDDGAHITLTEGEKFMTHARSGGSS